MQDCREVSVLPPTILFQDEGVWCTEQCVGGLPFPDQAEDSGHVLCSFLHCPPPVCTPHLSAVGSLSFFPTFRFLSFWKKMEKKNHLVKTSFV